MMNRTATQQPPSDGKKRKVDPDRFSQVVRKKGTGYTVKFDDIRKFAEAPSNDQLLKKLDKKADNVPAEPFEFQHPWRGSIVGASGTGKTRWLIRYLLEFDYDAIIWVTNKVSAEQGDLKILKQKYGKFLTVISVVKNIDADEITSKLKAGKAKKWKQIVVFDDLIHIAHKPFIMTAFTGFRHYGCSVVEILQQIFPDKTRSHRLNSDVFVIFKFSMSGEVKRLAVQLYEDKDKVEEVVDMYKQVTGRNIHSCLIIDIKSEPMDGVPLTFRDTKVNCIIPYGLAKE